jgi:ABC-type Na+ efflux pump permease subunit
LSLALTLARSCLGAEHACVATPKEGEEHLFLGPVFVREAWTSPRRPNLYVIRAVYVLVLFVLMCTAWLVLAGTQTIRNVGDMARFGSILFQILAPLQLAVMVFLAAMVAASAVSQEKDRRTLILLLMTRMSNLELVVGKLSASLLQVLMMWAAALPVFLMLTLFGGVSFVQVVRVFAVTLMTVLAAGSLGSTIALWREKTFQTLAMTALILVLWIGLWEAVAVALPDLTLVGLSSETWLAGLSPVRAIMLACQPLFTSTDVANSWRDGVVLFLLVSSMVVVCLNGISIAWVRVWNPSREVRPGQAESSEAAVVPDGGLDILGQPASGQVTDAEQARSGHVDARVRLSRAKTREVWDNPILWREVCTWAHGRKVLIIRAAYLLLSVMAAAGLYQALEGGIDLGGHGDWLFPPVVLPLALFFLVSMVLVNALAVTSVTNERDGQALDLLLVTDLSPGEFVFGKLGGVFWVTKEMVLLPLLFCGYLWWRDALTLENLVYVWLGLGVMYIFVNMLGIHCGMNYANSRTAIGVSLGVVFFLFLGVVTCIYIMYYFSGSFQTQLGPFLAFTLGGGVGLFAVLGYRNPSQAMQLATLVLPLATFYSITSFQLGNPFAVVTVVVATYGFTTAAMLVPAVYEFDIAMGRTKTAGGE